MRVDGAEVQRRLDRAAGVAVVVIGDVMLDRFVAGQVSRISPEAPIPVFVRSGQTAMLGGAGNAARNVAALGARGVLLGVVGDDADGRELQTIAAAEPQLTLALVRDSSRPTTLKTRFVAQGQQLLRVDAEDARPLDPATETAMETGLAALSPAVVLVSDYAKGVLTPRVLQACHAVARRAGAPLIVDPKGRDFARYGEADLIKPNLRELAELTGLPVGDDAEVEAALARALDLCPARAILVTRAHLGMSLMARGAAAHHARAERREVFDVSGAGDTALAALGVALGGGAALDEAIALAVLASGVAVGKAGTATVSADDLLHAARTAPPDATHAKLADPARAGRQAKAWKAEGLKVGFTNGCFDVLHRGHVDYLAHARAACDRLIVGINVDASVSRLKGPSRPVNDLASRMAVLAALGAVDLVVFFEDDTPLALIQALRPQVLFKGGDYTRDTVVGADQVESWGGEVVIAPLTKGYSTTAALDRVARPEAAA